MRRSVVRSLAAFIIVSLLGWSAGRTSSAPIASLAFKTSSPSLSPMGSRLAHSSGVSRVATVVILPGSGTADGPDQAAVTLVTTQTSAPTRYPVTISVELAGTNTQFSAGTTTANFGPGISVGGGGLGEVGLVEVRSSTSATAHISIDASAAPGPRAVIVNTGQHRSIATFFVPPNPTVPAARAAVLGFVDVGKTVYLDGTGSTIDGTLADAPGGTQPNVPTGQELAFQWTLIIAPDGSSASVINDNSAQAKLVPDKPGEYAVQLTVRSGTGSTSTWAVLSTNNAAPIARAGADQFVAIGDAVRLNGSGSTDMDGDALSYEWNLVSAPAGSSVALSNRADVWPTFTVDADGDYLFRLDVNDGHGHTSSDNVLVSTVSSSPIAVVGPAKKVVLNQFVDFDGSSSSDPAGKPITCAWRLLSKPSSSNAQFSTASSAKCAVNPTFIADQFGVYVAQLTVSDPDGYQAVTTAFASTDQVSPVADLGSALNVGVGDTVALDGRRSTDPDGNSLTYIWSLLSKPLNSAAVLSQALSAQPVFVADLPGNYVAQLIVRNGNIASTPKTVLISAQPTQLEVDSNPALGVNVGNFIPSRPPRPTRSQLVQILPSSLSFKDQLVGTTSSSATVSISNPRSSTLSVTNLQLTGASPRDFAFSPVTTSLTVPANGSVSVAMTFTPSTSGARSATLRITDDTGQHDVSLYGNGLAPQISLAPASVAFDKQLVSTASQPIPVQITNTGTAPLLINGLSVIGANSSDFSFTATATPLTIQSQQSATINVTFTPTSATDRSAVLMIADNTPEASHPIPLTGTGVAPAISATPATLAFGNQLNGTPSDPLPLTVNNTGTADLVVSSLSLTGANAAEFVLSATPTLPLTIKAGQNAALAFVFTPSGKGNRTASLAIGHNATASPLNVAFSGTGTAPGIAPNPTSVSFGDQLVGTQSAIQSLTITNSGTAPLIITGLTITGADFSFASGFTPPMQTNTLTVAPGNSTPIPLTFKPLAEGTRSGTLSITGNAGVDVALSGNGTAPHIGLTTTSIQFNNQQVESTSTPATITLTNTGTASLTVSDISLAGSNSADFALGAVTTPFIVAPNTTANLTVAFKPTQLGPLFAQIAIASSATDSPSVIRLAGTGTGIPPQIIPPSVNFNDQVIGTTSSGSTLSINNPHSTPLSVSNLQLLGSNPGDFTFTPTATTFTVPAQGSASIKVKFSPLALGGRSATLRITDNTGTTDVTLAGNGTAPAISVAPTNLAFGNQLNGTASNPLTLTIHNTGTADLVVSSLSIVGVNAADFAVSAPPSLPLTIKPGQNAALTFVFTPSATGSRTASLTITHNATGSPLNVAFSGTGTAPSISPNPSAINFGDQLVATQSAVQTVTVTNSGTADLIINGLMTTGTHSADFLFAAGFTPPTQATPITVAPGNSTAIPLTFKPSAEGTRSGTLAIVGNASANISLSGNGTAPAISLAPTTLTFGSQLNGTSSDAITLTINNPGTADLVVFSLAITGTNASDFAFSVPPTLPLTIKAGQNATLGFVFTPSATGSRNASLAITHNAAGSSLNVTFFGTGIAPSITTNPTAVSFGDQLVATQSTTRPVMITNSGTAPLTINGLLITGANSADFLFTSGFTAPTQATPIMVAPGNSSAIPLTFKPSAEGTRSGTLVIAGNASANVALTGTGIAPVMSAVPIALAFGNQPKGTSSAPMAITINNTGTGDLLISNLVVAGPNAADFTLSTAPTYPIVIPAGTKSSVALIFTPATAASESASLTITSNATQTIVPLSGTGTVAQISFSPANAVAFGNQLLNISSAVANVVISNPGAADLRITKIAISGSNPADFALSQSPEYPIVVSPNNSTSIGVIFTPKTLSTETATLSFTDNVTGSPHMLSLSGTGVAPAIGPLSAINFGNINVGSTSSAMTLTVANPGTAPLHITSLNFAGTNATDFSTTTTAPIVVDPNGTVTISLNFAPTAPGQRNSALLITDDAMGSPHSATLSGFGVGVPKFSVNPISLDFGSIADGSTTAPQALSIANVGSADLVIDHMIKTGANAGDFSYSVVGTHNNDFPATVTPGSNLTVNVFFTPTDPGGTRTATLIFQDASNTSFGSVGVSGVGIAAVPQISLSKTSLTFPPTPTTISSAPLGIVVTNNGTKDLTISSLTFTGINASDFSVTPVAPVVVPKSGGTATLNVRFKPTALGSRSATLAITNDAGNIIHDDIVTVSGIGRDIGRLSLQPATVGKNLELLAIGSVDVAPSADLSITISSSDPSKLLLSPLSTDTNGVNTGVASFVGILPKGKGIFGNGFPAFWIQALASSGTAQITMTAPGYTSTTATITFAPSGFVLTSPLGIGSNFTTQLNAADSNLTVTTAQLGSGNSVVLTNQKLRGGLDVSVDIANATPATGTLSGTPVSIPSGSGSSASGAVKFHPVAVGTTLLSIIQPGGYSTPASGSQLTATVQSPSISLTPTLVGYNLEVLGLGMVNIAAPAGGLQVTLTSSDPGKVLLSTDQTAPGSSSITLTIPAGTTTIPAYYIHGLASSGTATLTATASGYSNGIANVGLNPSGFIINSQNSLGQFTADDFVTTTISVPNPLQVSVWQLDSLLRPVVVGQLRGGISTPVQVVSGTSTTGTIIDGSVTFHGGDSAQTGILFEPNSTCISPCTSVLSITHTPDYATPAPGGQITATVTMPAIAIRLTETSVGNNLEVEGSGALDVPAPVDLTVTITSNNPNVLLSASATDLGSQTLNLTVPVGSGLNSIGFPPYYIQSLSDTGSAQLTILAPGFSPSTANVTLVPSAFVIEGPNGIGNDFGVLLNSGNVPLMIRAALLNPNTLNPTVIYQAVRGGFFAAVDVTSSAPSVATIVGTPVVITSGNQSGTVTMQPLSAGQANIVISAPVGYATPASGNHFSVTVN